MNGFTQASRAFDIPAKITIGRSPCWTHNTLLKILSESSNKSRIRPPKKTNGLQIKSVQGPIQVKFVNEENLLIKTSVDIVRGKEIRKEIILH